MIKNNKKKIIAIVLIMAILVLIAAAALLSRKWRDITTIDNIQYDATAAINEAMSRLKKDSKGSEIVTDIYTKERILALTFQGFSDPKTNYSLLKLLSDYNRKGTFFVPGIGAAEDSDTILQMYKSGHRIGSNTLSGAKSMEEYSEKKLVEDFARSNTIIENIIGQAPSLLLCNSTVYTPKVLQAAYACGNLKAVKSTHFLNYQSFTSYDQVLGYVKALDTGSIITIKLSGVLDEREYEKPGKPGASQKPAAYNKGGVDSSGYELASLTEEERLLKIVEWLLEALKEAEYNTVFLEEYPQYVDEGSRIDKDYLKEVNRGNQNEAKNTSPKQDSEQIPREYMEGLRAANHGKKSQKYNTIYTTEQALSYTFYGISSREVLKNVLTTLDTLGVKGTFFVTEQDLKNSSEEIKEIADRGHEIGICLSYSTPKNFYSILESILKIKQGVEAVSGQKPVFVRYAYDVEMNMDTLEAISAAGCTAIGQDIALASSQLSVNATLEDIMDRSFKQGNITVRRGYIIYYRMDYYKDPFLIGKLMMKIKNDRIDTIAYADNIENNGTLYSIKPLGDIVKSDRVYSYPLGKGELLEALKDRIHSGHLKNMTETEKFRFIQGRYIGTPSINTATTLPGFSEEELRELDKTGRFTEDKTLFLTFDDWGSDKAISQILYVLNKYDIKASFFIRTNYVESNPNLLRAIAEAGHDVGSHTDRHLSFATTDIIRPEDDADGIYYSLTPDEAQERQEDINISYHKLQSIIGDIENQGKPALTRILRPPTLAMSREGMEAILDMGFNYIVSGDFSTHDYQETDSVKLAEKIINGIDLGNGRVRSIQNGSVLVMHMSDDSFVPSLMPDVTAKALDIVIPILQSKGYNFAKLSDYLTDNR